MQASQPDDAEVPDLADQQAQLRKAHRQVLMWSTFVRHCIFHDEIWYYMIKPKFVPHRQQMMRRLRKAAQKKRKAVERTEKALKKCPAAKGKKASLGEVDEGDMEAGAEDTPKPKAKAKAKAKKQGERITHKKRCSIWGFRGWWCFWEPGIPKEEGRQRWWCF